MLKAIVSLFADMVAGGLPEPQADHAKRIAAMGLGMIEAAARVRVSEKPEDEHLGMVNIRGGAHTGSVIASVVRSHHHPSRFQRCTVIAETRPHRSET